MPNRAEEVLSKGAGKVKAVTAGVKGLRGVFKHLAEEHAEANVLLKRAMAAHDPAKQQDVWSKLRAELLSHEHAELSVVYPELAKHSATLEIAARHYEEAEELEIAILCVDQAAYGTDTWKQSVEALWLCVNRHAEEEEAEFFPRAQDTLDQQTVQVLKYRFEQAKQAAKGTS